MATISTQKDLVVAFKKGTYLDVRQLSKLVPMPPELSRQLFQENTLDKPTQTFFNHLSHYLVYIIDPAASASLPWPLYDTKTERAYRNELSNFITAYSNKGLLGAVVSSYFVNPGCFKVTKLMFEMSQLAVQRLLTANMKKDSQKKLYHDMTVKYKSQEKDGYIELIEKETELILSRYSNYFHTKSVMEKIAELLRKKITDIETKLRSVNAQKYLSNLVDGFLSKHDLDEASKAEIMRVKIVYQPAPVFDRWLIETDRQIDQLESKWSEKVSPLLSIAKNTQEQTELLVSRCTGLADRSSYTIEYNHRTDFICTKELQTHVNTQQKYVLKNIIKDEKLNFPNLIRGFLIAVSFLLKNVECGDEIYKFNEYLEGGQRSYHDIVMEMRALLERVMNAEARLQPSPVSYNSSISVEDIPEIPPLPDLSCLRNIKTLECQALFDSLTPHNTSKHQFNLRRRTNMSVFRTQPKPLLVPQFSQGPKEDFLNNLILRRESSYEHPIPNVSQFHNMSAVSRANETIAGCSSGFTKEQIQRLLSTKKTSSSKKFRHKTDRSNINIKKGGLFESNEWQSSNESNCLFRSFSSPNLFENREKRPSSRTGCRKLSIMQEDRSLLEVSGIATLEKDSFNSPIRASRNTNNLPTICITPADNFNEMLKEYKVDLNLDDTLNEKIVTPKANTQLIKKTSSLEKIINRFKKVRENSLPVKSTDEFKSIAEEKENIDLNVFTVNRVLLPDLLSPNCSVKLDEEKEQTVRRKPRESLGTVLGVDQTILDQFDLID